MFYFLVQNYIQNIDSFIFKVRLCFELLVFIFNMIPWFSCLGDCLEKNFVGELHEITQKKLLPPPKFDFSYESENKLFHCTAQLMQLSMTGYWSTLIKLSYLSPCNSSRKLWNWSFSSKNPSFTTFKNLILFLLALI